MHSNASPHSDGRLPARGRIEQQIARMDANAADSALALLRRRDAEALAEASAWDALAAATPNLPDLFGLGLTVKACFDVTGWTTTAGSKVLADTAPASADAPLVGALRRAGAIVTSQANMTEFAFGALGLNPHYGTPRTPLDPQRERIAGGSTSGGAVAVALGFADLALGSDTSGSIRIPAAFCGLAGFKPSRGRYPEGGLIPLSPSFDVPGFMARDIETCALADRVVTGDVNSSRHRPDLRGCRFIVPSAFAYDGTEAVVASAFRRALRVLEQQGAIIVEKEWPELATYGQIAAEGGMIVSEAFVWHEAIIEAGADRYDPRVGPRIMLGKEVKAASYIRAKEKLAELAHAYHCDMADCDAVLTPAIPFLPPKIADLTEDATYFALNRACFRFTELANRIDAPSVSLPIDPTEPIGLLLTGRRGGDLDLLDLSRLIQTAFRSPSP
ncbi:amidase/aspartyl-tRNA(Asn)/glutamyl-tRNA(Gln) amidotransferase subunit A [Rhodoligotrophos appendicifer]|uniref:amidase family protein n=1 Tax=Rhodoligotrophos appendicifer TaxID=987056 RepID=UPI0014784503|nr:amidase family protein [Rhodoligotrophos appendicifer]